MKKSCHFFRLPMSTICQYQRCSTVTPQKLPKYSQLIWKEVHVYVEKYFNLDGLILLFGFFKSDTEIGFVECLLTNIWGVSSLFKRKNICKTFSKPFILGTLRAFNAQYLITIWFTKPWLFVLRWPCCEVRWPEKTHELESTIVVVVLY